MTYYLAMGSVTTAQDVTMVFDAYSQYEESMLQAQMSSAADVSPIIRFCALAFFCVIWRSGLLLDVVVVFPPL